MTSAKTLSEFHAAWLPHISDSGLRRLTDLLEAPGSPMLCHGTFQKAPAAGCLATHIAWHHPRTRHLNEEAGVIWLAHVAKLNPATSHVIQDWDRTRPRRLGTPHRPARTLSPRTVPPGRG